MLTPISNAKFSASCSSWSLSFDLRAFKCGSSITEGCAQQPRRVRLCVIHNLEDHALRTLSFHKHHQTQPLQHELFKQKIVKHICITALRFSPIWHPLTSWPTHRLNHWLLHVWIVGAAAANGWRKPIIGLSPQQALYTFNKVLIRNVYYCLDHGTFKCRQL